MGFYFDVTFLRTDFCVLGFYFSHFFLVNFKDFLKVYPFYFIKSSPIFHCFQIFHWIFSIPKLKVGTINDVTLRGL